MSADLLAEFDSYYVAPQKGNSKNASDGSSKPSSGLNDLSFFSSNPATSAQPSHTAQYSSQSTDISDFNTFSGFDAGGSREASRQETQDDGDGWGDFESPIAEPEAVKGTNTQGSTDLFGSGMHSIGSGHGQVTDESRYGAARVTTIPQGNFLPNTSNVAPSSAAGFHTKYTPNPKPSSASSMPASVFPKDPNVLFDADNVSDDDDFGDFETVVTPPQKQWQGGYTNDNSILAGFNDAKNPLPSSSKSRPLNPSLATEIPQSASLHEVIPFAGLDLNGGSTGATKQRDTTAPSGPARPRTGAESFHGSFGKPDMQRESKANKSIQSPPMVKEDTSKHTSGNSWDWDAVEVAPTHEIVQPTKEDSWAWDVAETQPKEDQTSSPSAPPPTNIPPPSVLLTVFPQLLDLSQSSLFQPVSSQPFSLKNRILSDPTTINFIRAYILLATVAGRIIAGRKYRWKRDTHLSQAMKIGPAAAGGKGGMKLVGVDKAEISREDREANEFIRTWQDQVGRLRSAVAIANSSIRDTSGHIIVPEISGSMPVRTATAAEGAVTAPKPCFICGLKRDERISKVDVQVEDSFGEWWVEHWGHKACRNFWMEHDSKLKHN
ncbi:hypothetical protein VE01_00975 [Pseudogymnoascus verrucosus]|uniref:Serine/threonine-protein kinase ppk6 n=1 Tax=Pseudogymnoascus verrucosus TaxID=342668 RepID=A0A2P2SW63_9PEZI|nr:uncharacterized protein VE01_00975 [Pseudogymnoascus verrucosus]OBU01051.1 hypothetical protein VE01_00975 [Pseudogymnoascus verrucosus]